jgi:hypothetical protein
LSDQSLKNLLVLLPVLVGIGLASYFLYNDYHSRLAVEDASISREIIGEMIRTENNVKRQVDNDVLWNSIQQKTPIYNRDSIRTGSNSTASIKLIDNTIIDVNESSLIVLDKTQQNLNLRFKAGDIAMKNSGSRLEIDVNNSIIKGAGADINIKTSDNGGKANIQVSKGKATVTDKNKKTAQVNQSEEASLIDDDLQEVNQIAVILKSPETKTQIMTSKGTYRQAFTWEVLQTNLKAEQFEISKSNLFKPGASTKIFRAHQAVSPELSVGTYYWRVGWQVGKPPAVKTRYSENRQLIIGSDAKLDLLFPEDESAFDFADGENTIDFQWKCQIPAKAFVVEVAIASNFRKIAFTKTLASSLETIKDLPSGSYFWRVRAFGERNEAIAESATRTFSVHSKMSLLPELIKPEENATGDSLEPIEFSWKKMELAAEYRLIISHDLLQKEIVKTKTVQITNLSSPPPPQGIYYWSVRALNQKLAVAGQSEVRRINFRPKSKSQAFVLTLPKEKSTLSRESNDVGLEPVLFQWQITKTLPGPVSLLLSQTSDFKEVIRLDGITQLSASQTLAKSGVYFWKLISQGQTTSGPSSSSIEESETASFTLRVANQFAAPTLIEPADGSSIELATAESPSQIVKFSWTPMPTAFQYHVIVERIDPKKPEPVTVIDRVMKDWTLTSQPLVPGNYSWSVSSMTSDGSDGGQSKPFKFNVVPPIEMEAPQLNAPVVK